MSQFCQQQALKWHMLEGHKLGIWETDNPPITTPPELISPEQEEGQYGKM